MLPSNSESLLSISDFVFQNLVKSLSFTYVLNKCLMKIRHYARFSECKKKQQLTFSVLHRSYKRGKGKGNDYINKYNVMKVTHLIKERQMLP